MPDVPTVAESGIDGLKDFEVVSWQAIFVPAGTPAPVIDRLHDEIRKILAQPEMQEKLKGFGMEPADMTTAQISAFQKTEVDKWAQVIKAAGVKAD
jgi:tripartite-type tricarboxylate transporter receptor subunit TctC